MPAHFNSWNLHMCRVLAKWSAVSDAQPLTPPDIPALSDLLEALRELHSSASFLHSRKLASSALEATRSAIDKYASINAMPVAEIRRRSEEFKQEFTSHMEPAAIVALRVFVQQGGQQGSRMFTVRFDNYHANAAVTAAKSKGSRASPQNSLQAASGFTLEAAKQMETLVSDERVHMSVFAAMINELQAAVRDLQGRKTVLELELVRSFIVARDAMCGSSPPPFFGSLLRRFHASETSDGDAGDSVGSSSAALASVKRLDDTVELLRYRSEARMFFESLRKLVLLPEAAVTLLENSLQKELTFDYELHEVSYPDGVRGYSLSIFAAPPRSL
jgi:hypothetical protein